MGEIFSRHGAVAGVVAFLLSSMLMILEFRLLPPELNYKTTHVAETCVNHGNYVTFVFAFATAILSGLLTYGFHTDQHLILVPWLLSFVIISFIVFVAFNFVEFCSCFAILGIVFYFLGYPIVKKAKRIFRFFEPYFNYIYKTLKFVKSFIEN